MNLFNFCRPFLYFSIEEPHSSVLQLKRTPSNRWLGSQIISLKLVNRHLSDLNLLTTNIMGLNLI